MKYGVYSYSMYESPKDARYEAKTLSQRAPKAAFTLMIMKNKPLNPEMMKQHKAWANEMKACWKQEDPFYSYENFMLNHASNAVSSYDGYWLATYQAEEPRESAMAIYK